MSYERRDLAVRAAEGDTLVDAAGKVGDAVLEVMVRDLHDVRLVFNDRDVGTLGEFARGVAEAVFGDDGVRVDDEDDLGDLMSVLRGSLSVGGGTGKNGRKE